MSNIIQTKNFSVSLNDKELTHVKDFSISSGGLVQLQGANGSGKTSFLQSCAGIIPHISGGTIKGNLSIFGVDLSKNSTTHLQGKVAYIPSEVDLFFMNNTVLEELCFTLAGLDEKLSYKELLNRSTAIANDLGFANLIEIPIAQLSSGQRAKCAIMCCIISQPKLLLLDEIMSSLDTSTRIEIEKNVDRYIQEDGMAIVADHDYQWKNARSFQFESPATENIVTQNQNLTVAKKVQLIESAKGMMVAIKGENGSGKTTLLRHLSGFVPREDLSQRNLKLAELLQEDLQVVSKKRRTSNNAFSYMPQEIRHMFRNAKVQDDFSDRTKKLPTQIINALNLERYLETDPSKLSYGQAKLCALGLATCTYPKVLLLDEPTRGLDIETRKIVIKFLVKLCLENDIKIICATHEHELIKACVQTYTLTNDPDNFDNADNHNNTDLNKVNESL